MLGRSAVRRRVNGYLARDVALAVEAGEPALVWGEQPRWRMPIHLCLPGWGQVAELGKIDVDAKTRDVIQLSKEQISEKQDRADTIAAHLAPPTAATG